MLSRSIARRSIELIGFSLAANHFKFFQSIATPLGEFYTFRYKSMCIMYTYYFTCLIFVFFICQVFLILPLGDVINVNNACK